MTIINYDSIFSVNSPKNNIDGRNIIILCFHDINGDGKYSISEEEFIEILDMLKTKYEVYSLKDWYFKIQNHEKFKKQPIVLTFDDGYASIFSIAIPLLKKYKFGATFFIYLEKYENQPWIFKEMASLPDNFEIGSHSFSHSDMEKLFKSNKKKFYKEIFLSRKKLEFLIGKTVVSWAWPYGAYTKDMIQMADEAGYKIQVNTDYKNTEKEAETTSFSRYTVQNPDPVDQTREILLKNSSYQ
ncbi:MAG: polysaccharide deacetylase family protein [Spirochaetia bacterium]|nr:polysaccharide deacetylase family protein [Spirochaetia bacterium]